MSYRLIPYELYVLQYAIKLFYKEKIEVTAEETKDGVSFKRNIVPKKEMIFYYEKDSDKDRFLKESIEKYGKPDVISDPIPTGKKRLLTKCVIEKEKETLIVPWVPLNPLAGMGYHFEEDYGGGVNYIVPHPF